MAITSYGYPETVAPGAAFDLIWSLAGRVRGVQGVGSWRVTANSGGTRQVNIATGNLFGDSIVDVNDATIGMASLPNVVSGSQYFLIVSRRHWNNDAGGYRTVVNYVAGTSARAVPSYTVTPGTVADLPLALVKINAGETVPAEIVDLRIAWENPSVATIWDDLALEVMPELGGSAYNAMTGVLRDRVGTSGYSTEWRQRYEPTRGERPLYVRGRSGSETMTANAVRYLAEGTFSGSAGDWGAHIGVAASADWAVGDEFTIKTSGVYSIEVVTKVNLEDKAGVPGVEGGWLLTFDVLAGGPGTGSAATLPRAEGTANQHSSGGTPLTSARYWTAGSRFRLRFLPNANADLTLWSVAIMKVSD